MNIKDTSIFKILTGRTRTKQVSGVSKNIVSSKDLSKQLYSQIDRSKSFTVESKNGKKYKVRQLVPSR
jgi:hypothetical protein